MAETSNREQSGEHEKPLVAWLHETARVRERCRERRLHNFTQTFFASVKNSSESTPPSRPTPLSFMPPKGTRRSRKSQQLIQTVPLSIAAATRWARCRSRVQTLDDKPYFVEFANVIASSSPSNGVMVTTGPK